MGGGRVAEAVTGVLRRYGQNWRGWVCFLRNRWRDSVSICEVRGIRPVYTSTSLLGLQA